MDKLALIINTNPGSDVTAVQLRDCLDRLNYNTEILNGHDYIDPRDHDPTHIFLSAVPADVDYSLTGKECKKFISQRYSWLKEIDVPVMGICFGHQIIAHIYEGKIKEMNKERVSLKYKIKVRDLEKSLGILEGIESIEGFVAHHDHVIPPSEFITLANSRKVCYAMKHQEKDIYGLQFHPELSGKVGKEIIKRFMELPYVK
jgi:GMP synthase-like glutamine amidotransferase